MDYIIKQLRYNVWQVLEVNRNAEREVGIIVQDAEGKYYSARPIYNPEWSHGHTSLDAAKTHIVDHTVRTEAS